jgi:HSP20 family protein
MAQLREQVNRLFEQSLSHAMQEPTSAQTWSPAVDIYETREQIGLRIDASGVKPEAIDIQITDDTLTIRGERKLEKAEDGKQYVRLERSYGPFQRSFTLGVPITQQGVRATYQDGVLEILLPKREETKPKPVKVEVQASPTLQEIAAK